MATKKINRSEILFIKNRLDLRRDYEKARMAGLHPTLYSKILHGAIPIREGDKRVLAIARVLGVSPEEAFSSEV